MGRALFRTDHVGSMPLTLQTKQFRLTFYFFRYNLGLMDRDSYRETGNVWEIGEDIQKWPVPESNPSVVSGSQLKLYALYLRNHWSDPI